MRIHTAIAIAASLIAVEAHASSILVVESSPATASSSVIVAPELTTSVSSVDVLNADEIAQISRSVVAVGELPAVSGERVAAISDGKTGGRVNTTTMVLRGGVAGEALPAPVAEPEAEPVKELSRPAQRAKERNERRAVREAMRFGEPLPQKTEAQPAAEQPSNDQGSGT